MQRIRYLIAYDIRNPKRLRQVAAVVKGYGTRLQYSLFICDLDLGELTCLRFDLREVMNSSVDSVAILPLGFGYDFAKFEFLGPRPVLPIDGPRIV